MKKILTGAQPTELPDDSLLTEAQAAKVLDVEPGTLAVWRCTKRYKIPYIKIGRNVRYRRRALHEWIDSCTHNAGD